MAHGKNCSCKACKVGHGAIESPSKEAREDMLAKKGKNRKASRKSGRR